MTSSIAAGSRPPSAKKRLLASLLAKKGIVFSQDAAITPRPSGYGPVPLSFNQEGMWFIEQFEPGRAMYNIPGTVLVRGALDIDALEQALATILRRHDSLRTTFRVIDGAPRQVVSPPGDFRLSVVDARGCAPRERQREIARLSREVTRAAFDLEKGPLFRAGLLRFEEREHALVFATHHIVCDGWSMGIFTRELEELYSAKVAGRPANLPELPIQYADYAAWEREYMRGAVLADHLAYWRQQLDGVSEPFRLPADHAPASGPSRSGKHLPFELRGPTRDRLRRLSDERGVTLFHTLLAAFAAVLHERTGETSVTVGSTFANRRRPELESLIGCFVNVLPLRIDLSGNPPFDELQRRVSDVVVAVAKREGLSLPKLVKELQPERNLNREPFFQIMFYYMTPDHSPAVYGFGVSPPLQQTVEVAGITLEPIDVEVELARYDIVVIIWDLPEGLSGTVEYSTDLYEPATISSLISDFGVAVDAVLRTPGIALEELCRSFEMKRKQRQVKQSKAMTHSFQKKLEDIKSRNARRPRAGGQGA